MKYLAELRGIHLVMARFAFSFVAAIVLAVASSPTPATDVDLNATLREGTKAYVNQDASVSGCVLRIQLRYPGQCRPEFPEIGLLGMDIYLDLREFSDEVRSKTGMTNGVPYVELMPLDNADEIFMSARAFERQLVLSAGTSSHNTSPASKDPVDRYLEEQGALSRVHMLACSGKIFTTAPSGAETRIDVTADAADQIAVGLSSYAREFCRDK